MPATTYVTYGGASLPPPPYLFKQTRFMGHAFSGDEAAQQAFVDRTLNQASTPGRFEIVSPFVFLLCVSSPALGGTTPPFSNEGTIAETDVGFWIPVKDGSSGTLMLQPAYLFVDNWIALAGGREIWGFPKALGAIQTSAARLQDGPIVVASLVLPEYQPETKASVRQVFRLDPPNPLAAILSDPTQGLLDQIRHAVIAPAAGADFLVSLVRNCVRVGGMTFATFKQFRNAASATGTVYSAVVTTRTKITALRCFGVLGGGYRLTLASFDSQPVARDLGLVAGVQHSIGGVWVDMDFVLDLAD